MDQHGNITGTGPDYIDDLARRVLDEDTTRLFLALEHMRLRQLFKLEREQRREGGGGHG